jgi:hypothetical protein
MEITSSAAPVVVVGAPSLPGMRFPTGAPNIWGIASHSLSWGLGAQGNVANVLDAVVSILSGRHLHSYNFGIALISTNGCNAAVRLK